MTATYDEFLVGKRREASPIGLPCESDDLPDVLYPWQRDVTSWAIRRGSAAIFADCGLGKTLMQIAWADRMREGCAALIVAPLGVTGQTIREAGKLGLEIQRIEEGAPDGDGIYITNYERLHKFNPDDWNAIVLDESSILKSVDGKTRTRLLQEWTHVPYRLCCTATPAPNDTAELANHSEFIGAATRSEMLASYFVHDDSGWRLKGHAHEAMWKWVASWAVWVRSPDDLGHDATGYDLPPLTVRDEVIRHKDAAEGELFASSKLGGVGSRAKMRRATMAARIARAAEVIANSDDQWVVWHGLNDEGRGLLKALGDDAVLIEGRDSEQKKVDNEKAWREGGARVLITKPKIFGFGMNWQHCSRMLFLGLGDSYEQYYQAIRRCWRFGQAHPVDVVIVTSDAEGEVAANVRRKETATADMADRVTAAIREAQIEEVRGDVQRDPTPYDSHSESGIGWSLMMGDCVERIKEVESDSVGLSVFSPPFATLYTYSASDRDMGNCASHAEFFDHYKHLLPELLRVTMPGRRCATHVQQLSMTKATHGVIGWFDFRARVVEAMIEAGWIYDGEVVIDKCPQAQAIRTKAMQLMFATLKRDSNWLRPAMADYILLFRKPGENPTPVKSDVSNDEWVRWARPIWYGITESKTLQRASARENDDERHICPLQLETIERCVRLWSNKGDMILSPFAGIGSEGYQALKLERQFTGIELKESYWKVAKRNLQSARRQKKLFESF